MDITLAAHGVAVPDRFKDYVDEKADKVLALADRGQHCHVQVQVGERKAGVFAFSVSAILVLCISFKSERKVF